MPTYFGYFGDGFAWLTPATAEVCGHVNISWVSASDLADMTGLISRLTYAHRLGLKVALAVPHNVFFEENLTLTAKYADNWEYFVYHVRPYIQDVAFLYPLDEPYSQGKVIGTPAADMKARLETVASLIKTTFPAIPLAFSFSAIDFDTQESAFSDLANPVPAGYYYFGFDCYGSWDSCGEPDYRAVHPIPWYVSQIEGKLGAGQRIMLFADAFIRQARPADPARDSANAALLLVRADQYYQLALSDSLIVGLFGFLYQDDYVEESRRFLGVKHWPALQTRYVEIGRRITSK
ncbi:MAG: hypothetical protein EXR93_05230 [Gemmatimonadetes bacterium]|nr:hypothetical protein [Gemmatimonadota bacterium]